MSHALSLHPEVKHEIAAGKRWYERSRPGLGREFDAATRVAVDAVAAHPLSYGATYLDIRAAPVSGFPYVVYYRVLRNRVRVLAVHHTARDPAAWQSRK